MNVISPEFAYLWAKKSKFNKWVPLIVHMYDAAGIAEFLWDNWISQRLKNTLVENVTNVDYEEADEEEVKNLFVFLSFIHDLGKATPVFQVREAAFPSIEVDKMILRSQIQMGLSNEDAGSKSFASSAKIYHSLASNLLLHEDGFHKNISAIVGAHHGKPVSEIELHDKSLLAYPKDYHFGNVGKENWRSAQKELVKIGLNVCGFKTYDDLPIPNMAAQILLSGLIIMADWLASNEYYFPYFANVFNWYQGISLEQLQKRKNTAWSTINLPNQWYPFVENTPIEHYQKRFGQGGYFYPRPLQKAAFDIANQIIEPGIMIIEAPMGVGKTEAALAVAEQFAQTAMSTGVFFALPTQATSNSMYKRIESWINNFDDSQKHSIRLFHSKAQFNDEYLALYEGSTNLNVDEPIEEGAYIHQWFEGNKKSLLADFVVGTIDQLLMAGLKQKHVMLRHLGLANKVVIIDECHAYDAYMNEYLYRVLNYLGLYKVPVIVLSATLPDDKRLDLMKAYLNEEAPDILTTSSTHNYPLISWSDLGEYHSSPISKSSELDEEVDVKIERLSENEFYDKLSDDLNKSNGCIGIIRNTVKKAQEMAEKLIEIQNSEVVLVHSRYLPEQRAALEKMITEKLGKGNGGARPNNLIVVGTQVLEQSLDIDFDILYTDLCPIDLLIQRIGRMHRHKRQRPQLYEKANCFVFNLEDNEDNINVYGEYLLLKTEKILPERIVIPSDIPLLVNTLYKEVDVENCSEELKESLEKHNSFMKKQVSRARDYRLEKLYQADSYQRISNWLQTYISDSLGEAAVRDTDESLEVVLLQEVDDDHVKLLYGGINEKKLRINDIPEPKIAREIAKQSIRLPSVLCRPWRIEKTIDWLEQEKDKKFKTWDYAPWLKGELYLVLNKELETRLEEYTLTYDMFLGLRYHKEEGLDGGKKV
ncbi:MAG: CRISPR-associated helicase Cas3' [Firmicutes bacterium]|nr:CRISPR-associated helicase Cas3' [Bacillota bacterium]